MAPRIRSPKSVAESGRLSRSELRDLVEWLQGMGRPKRILIDFWFSIGVGLIGGWTCRSLSRALLLLTGIQLITMPFTQYLWTLDHFLHGLPLLN